MAIGKPINPDANADQNTPLAATRDAFLVSSATWPEASNPTNTPAVTKNDNILISTMTPEGITNSRQEEPP